jgi:hypothetical protein
MNRSIPASTNTGGILRASIHSAEPTPPRPIPGPRMIRRRTASLTVTDDTICRVDIRAQTGC